jgi:hypothetical protein
MARPEGLEPPTLCFEGRCSIQLSYGRTVWFYNLIIVLAGKNSDSSKSLLRLDCTLEMRRLGWAHFAGKGLQSETEAILSEVSADGGRAYAE